MVLAHNDGRQRRGVTLSARITLGAQAGGRGRRRTHAPPEDPEEQPAADRQPQLSARDPQAFSAVAAVTVCAVVFVVVTVVVVAEVETCGRLLCLECRGYCLLARCRQQEKAGGVEFNYDKINVQVFGCPIFYEYDFT